MWLSPEILPTQPKTDAAHHPFLSPPRERWRSQRGGKSENVPSKLKNPSTTKSKRIKPQSPDPRRRVEALCPPSTLRGSTVGKGATPRLPQRGCVRKTNNQARPTNPPANRFSPPRGTDGEAREGEKTKSPFQIQKPLDHQKQKSQAAIRYANGVHPSKPTVAPPWGYGG